MAAAKPVEASVETSAAAPTDAAPAPVAASPAERESYLAKVRGMIVEKRRYPHAARRRRLESVVTMRITIGSGGDLVDARVIGRAPGIFERASIEAVEEAAPFPPPPVGFDIMDIPIRYEITR